MSISQKGFGMEYSHNKRIKNSLMTCSGLPAKAVCGITCQSIKTQPKVVLHVIIIKFDY